MTIVVDLGCKATKQTRKTIWELALCYDIKMVRKEEGKFYRKIPLGDDNATRKK